MLMSDVVRLLCQKRIRTADPLFLAALPVVCGRSTLHARSEITTNNKRRARYYDSCIVCRSLHKLGVYIVVEAVGTENQPIGEHDKGLNIGIRAESNLPSVQRRARSRSVILYTTAGRQHVVHSHLKM